MRTRTRAVPVRAEFSGGVGLTGTVESRGGPVAVDPLAFPLEAGWMPEYVERFRVDNDQPLRLELDLTCIGTDVDTLPWRHRRKEGAS